MQSLIIPFNHLILLKDEECVSFYKKDYAIEFIIEFLFTENICWQNLYCLSENTTDDTALECHQSCLNVSEETNVLNVSIKLLLLQ